MKLRAISRAAAFGLATLISMNAWAGPSAQQWKQIREARAENSGNVELVISCRPERDSRDTSRRVRARTYHVNPFRWSNLPGSCAPTPEVELADDGRNEGGLN